MWKAVESRRRFRLTYVNVLKAVSIMHCGGTGSNFVCLCHFPQSEIDFRNRGDNFLIEITWRDVLCKHPRRLAKKEPQITYAKRRYQPRREALYVFWVI
jgi:hypothetical protein